MNPLLAQAISTGIISLIEIWRINANKPAGWIPSREDWDSLKILNEKTAEDYKREAATDPIPPNIPEM